jgi:hypothetical protein
VDEDADAVEQFGLVLVVFLLGRREAFGSLMVSRLFFASSLPPPLRMQAAATRMVGNGRPSRSLSVTALSSWAAT